MVANDDLLITAITDTRDLADYIPESVNCERTEDGRKVSVISRGDLSRTFVSFLSIRRRFLTATDSMCGRVS